MSQPTDTSTPTRPTTITGTLAVPGARLHYEVRGTGPLVAIVGCPMDASPFAPLADLLATDHMVLTVDPRGVNRSPVDDLDQDVTPDMCADDLSRLLAHLDAGPATVVGSSGGALNALALAAVHPDQVDMIVAHEPPLVELLDDRDQQRPITDDIVATYLAGDVGGAWAKFMVQANLPMGPPDHDDAAPAPDGPDAPPADPQADADQRFFFLHWLRPGTRWQPDLDALRDGRPRIVVAVGDASAGQLCDRTSAALAGALGRDRAVFPGGHAGFIEDPTAFATRLRQVLADR